MRWFITMGVVSAMSVSLLAVDGKGKSFQFKKDDVGKVPAGWTAAKTGQGEGSVWKVKEDASSPSKTGYVLAQTAESPNGLYNICVADHTSYKDLVLSVAFKAIKGNNDQGGGLVWRYKDSNNYYIVRMNPLEDNFRVYKVIDGKRIQLATQEELKVPTGEWHRIKIEHKGDHILCYLDGKKHLDVTDTAIKDAGKIGLWSKSDAQSYFDDPKVEGE